MFDLGIREPEWGNAGRNGGIKSSSDFLSLAKPGFGRVGSVGWLQWARRVCGGKQKTKHRMLFLLLLLLSIGEEI